MQDVATTVARARDLDKGAVASLVAVFEDQRPDAAEVRAEVLALLDDARPGRVVGITGTPGSGKSSLVARLVPAVLDGDDDVTVGVLAVDPSSQVSRGALLGDRTRMRLDPRQDRAYVRSQATATDLGGLAPGSFQVTRLLRLLFDLVLVETVGIGQSELDVRHLADRVLLVLQPLGGDELQFLKAGIIEIPDEFVLNKIDVTGAQRSYQQLQSSLALARPFDDEPPPIHRVSARTGEGVDTLAADLLARAREGGAADTAGRDLHFLRRWVRDEWGRTGLRYLDEQLGDPSPWYAEVGGFDEGQRDLDSRIRDWLATD